VPQRLKEIQKQIFSRINSVEATKLVQDMVKIKSVNPPGNEDAMAIYLEKKMKEIGLEVHLDECLPGRPNVIGHLKGTVGYPTLMLNGHLDIVPPGDKRLWSFDPFGGVLKDGRIYGRGSADMKAGLASILLASKAIKLSGIQLKGDLMLTGVIDEEVTGLGAQELIRREKAADMVIVAEPTELNPVRAHKGLVFFEISTIGKAIHSSRVSSKWNKGEVNAIYQMGKVLIKIQEYLVNLEKKVDPLVGSPTISVGTITGGSKTNIVPDRCTITVDRRLLPSETIEDAKAEMENILQQLHKEDPRIKTNLKIIVSRRGAITNPDEPIVRLSKEAAEEVLGKDVEVTGSPATSDMEVFMNQRCIPTVLLGPGSLSMAHIIDEYVEVDQIVDAAKIFVIIALKTLG